MKHTTKNQLLLLFIVALLSSCGEPPKKAIIPMDTVEYASLTAELSNDVLIQQDSLAVNFQLRNFLRAFSNPDNAKESNGEYQSENLPKEIDKPFPKNKMLLIISEQEQTIFKEKYLGHTLYLVNSTNAAIDFSAQDSKLSIYIEAFTKSGTWKPISYMPSSFCGNSYHKITLDTNEYWQFRIPVFTGDYKTKIRYALSLDQETKLVSNEIEAYINLDQFDKNKQQGNSSENIMNPYSN